MAYGFNDNKSKYIIPNPFAVKKTATLSGRISSFSSNIGTLDTVLGFNRSDLESGNLLIIKYEIISTGAQSATRLILSDCIMLSCSDVLSYSGMGDSGEMIAKHFEGYKYNADNEGTSYGSVDVNFIPPYSDTPETPFYAPKFGVRVDRSNASSATTGVEIGIKWTII